MSFLSTRILPHITIDSTAHLATGLAITGMLCKQYRTQLIRSAGIVSILVITVARVIDMLPHVRTPKFLKPTDYTLRVSVAFWLGSSISLLCSRYKNIQNPNQKNINDFEIKELDDGLKCAMTVSILYTAFKTVSLMQRVLINFSV